MIRKTKQQDIDREGDRILRQALEPLGWVLTGIEEDYGFDYDVQVFAEGSPDGLWFKIQLKSSASSNRSPDGTFVSLQLSVNHARHYALELRDPVFLVHADIQEKKIYWSAPQLDNELIKKLNARGVSSSVMVRVPTSNLIPDTAGRLVETVERLYLVLGNRTLVMSSISSFGESLKYQPGEDKLREEFQRKNDILKLRRVHELLVARQYLEARARARVVVSDPDSTIENRFWAEEKVGLIDWSEAVTMDRPQSELPAIYLRNAKALQGLTKKGPPHLKLYALIARKAAELDQLAVDNWGLTILAHQHSSRAGNPIMAIKMLAAHAVSTMRFIAKYNQCMRLARYASNFRGRWILPRALARILQSAASFIGRIGRMDVTEMGERGTQFHSSALQICKLIAWIGEESADQEVLALAISAALLPINSQENDEFRWAISTLDRISEPDVKGKATDLIERQVARWKGRRPKDDSYRNPMQQIIENAASSLGIDLSDEDDPLVHGLRIAVSDNTPERVLQTCEHIVTSLGAMGPTARRIQALFGTQMAGSKILHCALHGHHLESKDFDSALTEFKTKWCDTCPDRAPRLIDWEFTETVQREFEAKHNEFITKFNASGVGFRFTRSD